MQTPWKETDPTRVAKTGRFLNDAFSDYLAARTLLRAHLPKQGAIFCSTAIEKCIKASLAIKGNGVRRMHLSASHWNFVQADVRMRDLIAKDFFELNCKVYALRYSDNLPIDFNLAIASREFLAEMDNTLLPMMSCFKVERNATPRRIGYEAAINNQDENLLAENHLIAGASSDQFVYQKPQCVYEVRHDRVRGLFDLTYMTNRRAKVPGFLRPALIPCDSTGYDMSHFPSGPVSLLSDGHELLGSALETLNN